MCIRDSAKATQEALNRYYPGQFEIAFCDPFPEFYSCLLYTSDAADERSSVDLGGRRIIKKKNTRTLTALVNYSHTIHLLKITHNETTHHLQHHHE